MRVLNLLKSSYNSITKYKVRSFLSILGVIIGVFNVIVILSISENLKNYVMNQYENIGNNLVWLIPQYGENNNSPGSQLTEEDINCFYGLPYIQKMSVYSAYTYNLDKNSTQGAVNVVGVSSNYFALRKFKVVGDFIREYQYLSKADVCVISDEVRKKYVYDNLNPIGEKLKINGKEFTIIGYIPANKIKNVKSGLDEEMNIYIPFSTYEKCFETKKIDMLIFSVKNEEDISKYKSEIYQKIVAAKNNKLEVKIDSVYDNKKNVSILFKAVILGTVLITSVGLLVSGIGIMNVLLMSVAERKWEIGLRKAIGASNKDILLQFLAESLILCIIGALIGLGISVALIEIISFFADVNIKISWLAVSVSVGFCCAVGLFFGMYPAIKAANLEPIECLEQ